MQNKLLGFSLLELIAVILIISILATTVIPKYIDYTNNAYNTKLKITADAFNTSVKLVHAQWLAQGGHAGINYISSEEGDIIGVNDNGWPANTDQTGSNSDGSNSDGSNSDGNSSTGGGGSGVGGGGSGGGGSGGGGGVGGGSGGNSGGGNSGGGNSGGGNSGGGDSGGGDSGGGSISATDCVNLFSTLTKNAPSIAISPDVTKEFKASQSGSVCTYYLVNQSDTTAENKFFTYNSSNGNINININ